MDWLQFEKAAAEKGYRHICGVDEAGRGPLAGPVCAAAVILPEGCIIEGVDDSKKLTEKKREALYDEIIGSVRRGGLRHDRRQPPAAAQYPLRVYRQG